MNCSLRQRLADKKPNKPPERKMSVAKIGIIRCGRNVDRCPMTGCLTCMQETRQGFQGYDRADLIGIFTCECPGDRLADYARILENKGADAIHLTTCAFAHKEEGKWVQGSGLCALPDTIMERLAATVSIPCIKGSAHLPDGYRPEVFTPLLQKPAGESVKAPRVTP